MGTPASAFLGAHSQTAPGATEVERSATMPIARGSLCVVHGRYYVSKSLPPMTGSRAWKLPPGFARVFVATTGLNNTPMFSRDQALFPPEGQLAGPASPS